LTFREALKLLADEAGIKLDGSDSGEWKRQIDRSGALESVLESCKSELLSNTASVPVLAINRHRLDATWIDASWFAGSARRRFKSGGAVFHSSEKDRVDISCPAGYVGSSVSHKMEVSFVSHRRSTNGRIRGSSRV
jgi:hypothetical protein